MAPPRTPPTVALLSFLADGEWHSVNEMASAIADVVPPEQAVRAFRYALRHSREQTAQTRAFTVPGRVRHYTLAEQAERGRREIARKIVMNLCARGAHPLECEKRGVHAYFRLRVAEQVA